MFSYYLKLESLVPIRISSLLGLSSLRKIDESASDTMISSSVSFEQYWSTCIDLLKRQIKDFSHSPSRHEEASLMMEQLHSRVAQVWQKTDHQRLNLTTSHVDTVQSAILKYSRFMKENPKGCREAVNSMVVLLRFMREIYPAKTINQSLRRQFSELEKYEAPDAKHYIDRIIPHYLPSRMPDSLKTLDARIYAIRWRGCVSLLELRATLLRDHPTWYRNVANEIKKLLNEAKDIKFDALTEALSIGAPHEELICIADHCSLFILIIQAQLRTLGQDSEKAEWVASILIEYINSLDLNAEDVIPSWSDDEDFTYKD